MGESDTVSNEFYPARINVLTNTATGLPAVCPHGDSQWRFPYDDSPMMAIPPAIPPWRFLPLCVKYP